MTELTVDELVANLEKARDRFFGAMKVYTTDQDGLIQPAKITLAKVVPSIQKGYLTQLDDEEAARIAASEEPMLADYQEWWDEMSESDRQYWGSTEALLKLNHDQWLAEQALLARHNAAPFSVVISA